MVAVKSFHHTIHTLFFIYYCFFTSLYTSFIYIFVSFFLIIFLNKITTIQDLVNAIGQLVNTQNTLTQQLGQPQAQQQPQEQQKLGNNSASTKISVKIPIFKGKLCENIVA